MAMDPSRLFTPPQNHVPESDPMIVRVPMDHMPWSARKSQQKGWDTKEAGTLTHIPNGK